MRMSLNIGLIGAGTLGKSLALGLTMVGYRVALVASRTPSTAKALAESIPGCRYVDSYQKLANQSDLVFITTPDEVISKIASEVQWTASQGVVHCSGEGSLNLLLPAAHLGARCGLMHPFQTFAGVYAAAQALDRFQGTTFALEADGWLLEALERIVSDLGGKVVKLKSEDRGLYHASAVMSCGYLVALLKASTEIWENLGFTKEEGALAILTIAKATIENALTLGLEKSVTGPLMRGDVETFTKDLEAIRSRLPHLLPLYLALSRASVPLVRCRIRGDKLRHVEERLAIFLEETPPHN